MRSQANVQINATSTSIWMHVCTHIAELLTTTTMPTPWRPQATWHGRKRERKCYDCLKKEVLNSRCLLARCDDGDLLAATAAAAVKAFQWYKGHNTHSHTYYSHMVARLKRPPRPRRSNTNQCRSCLLHTHEKKRRRQLYYIHCNRRENFRKFTHNFERGTELLLSDFFKS